MRNRGRIAARQALALAALLGVSGLPGAGSAGEQIAQSAPAASAVFSRTTVRQFDSAQLTAEETDWLVRAAFAAPTGGNQRALEVIVVTDRDMLVAMQAGNPYAGALDTAPLALVIAANEQTAFYPELLTLDAGMAAENVLIQAAAMGLSSVPMSIAPQEARVRGVSEALRLPAHVLPVIMVAVGHPAIDAVTSASVDAYGEGHAHYGAYGVEAPMPDLNQKTAAP